MTVTCTRTGTARTPGQPHGAPLRASLLLLALASACSSQPDSSFEDSGRFRLLDSFEVHGRPFTLQTADLNADGRLDVLVGGRKLTILLSDGSGGLTPALGTPFEALVDASDFAVADFDRDGYVDVAIADHDAPEPRFALLRGNMSGSFEPAAESPFVVDAVPHLHTLAASDFDGDGMLDLVTDSWPESQLVLVRGRGDGTFHTPGETFGVPGVPIQNLRSADMNGDGFADVVVPAHDAGSVTVLLSDGQGSFAQAPGSPFRSFGGFSTLALADMDRDGDTDVVEVHRSDQSTPFKQDAVSVLLNAGDGTLSHAPGSPHLGLPQRSNDLAVADLDGDGWLDIVSLGETHGELAVLLGGENGLALDSVSRSPGRARGIAAADLNGDGRAEVLVTDFAGSKLLVLQFESVPK